MPVKKIIIGLIIIILISAIAGAGWWFLTQRKKDVIQPIGQLENTAVVVKVEAPPVIDPDADMDGILDETEKKLGTSNKDFDTDHDWLSDYDEINKWKTDPTKKDTDGDGFSDGREVMNDFNPLGAGKL